MSWLIDVIWAVAILFASAMLGLAALAAARKLKLDRMWRPMVCDTSAPDQIITELAALADVSCKTGILGIESAAASSPLPLLSRGIAMVIAGSPAESVRRALGEALDQSILRGARLRKAVFWASVSSLTLCTLSIAALQLISAAAIASPDVLNVIPALFYLAAFAAMSAIACFPTIRDWSGRPAADRLLTGMLVIDGVCLIGTGKDGNAVTSQLRRLLPAQNPEARPHAAAA